MQSACLQYDVVCIHYIYRHDNMSVKPLHTQAGRFNSDWKVSHDSDVV